jgi:hypothetical protein
LFISQFHLDAANSPTSEVYLILGQIFPLISSFESKRSQGPTGI